ncbi:MAG: outer membrane beta-barrel protein [Bdellovibrio sp.]
MLSQKNILLLVVSFVLPSLSPAQNETEKLTSNLEWGGYFDFYYQHSPQAQKTVGKPANLIGRSFDNISNAMVINMAEISLKKKINKVTLYSAIAAGEMVDANAMSGGGSLSTPNSAANEPTRNFTQAYINYAATENFNITAGKYFSPCGLEGVKAKDNWIYSRSFLYSYGQPFWHEGINLNYVVIPGKLTSNLHVVNGWNGPLSQKANKAATYILALGLTPVEGLTVNYSGMIGSEVDDASSSRQMHDMNATYEFSPQFAMAVDLTTVMQKNAIGDQAARWSGYAVYAKYTPISWYSLRARYEMFDDNDQGFAISGNATSVAAASSPYLKQKITGITLSNSFDLGDGLETRLELRSDRSSEKGYFKNGDGRDSDKQESVTFAVLYAF